VLQMQAAGARLLQSSPGLAEKLAMTGKTGTVSRTSLNGRVDDRDSTLHDLRLQLDSEKDKNRSLEDSYKFRVATFVKRETTTRNKIDSLERKLNEGSEGDEHLVRMDVVRNMHKSVVSSLECIQNNTSKILQDQEKDLMRAFRNRLQEVSKEHEALKSRKGEHSSELQAKHRRVLGELYEAQELAQTFDKKNKTLQTENQRLQEQLRSREDDRSALLKDLVMTKKEVARLKLQCKEEEEAEGTATNKAAAEQAQATQKKSFSQKQVEQARQQQTQNKLYEREMSYREAITKLKRMVEAILTKVGNALGRDAGGAAGRAGHQAAAGRAAGGPHRARGSANAVPRGRQFRDPQTPNSEPRAEPQGHAGRFPAGHRDSVPEGAERTGEGASVGTAFVSAARGAVALQQVFFTEHADAAESRGH